MATLGWAEGRGRFSHPAFNSVERTQARLTGATWPSADALNTLLLPDANIRNAAIRFVAPPAGAADQHYELRIAASGEVATRDNWHDLFNALVWATFPRSKASISALHAAIIEAAGAPELQARSVPRDVLTLFDESGAIVVSEMPELLQLLREFRWKELFWTRREEVKRHMRVWLFGHALLEKMLDPYLGITAKCICLDVERGFAAADWEAQRGALDVEVTRFLALDANRANTRSLAPLPVLGWPGWDSHNESAEFYDNAQIFRAGYTRERR